MMADEISPWLVRVFAFAFGAIWGSFFNVAIHRWPRDMSVVSPPSHCPACGEPIRPGANVPIFGYLFLRGRARCCGARISPRYLLVEVITALLCVALAEDLIVRADPQTPFMDAVIETGVFFALCGLLVVATFTDLEWMIIPDEVTLTGTAIGLVTVGLRAYPGAVDAALGAGAGFLIVQLLFVWSYERLTGRRGMGEGDAKLLMMIGAFLGWRGMAFALTAGAVQGVVVAGGLMALGRSPTEGDSGSGTGMGSESESGSGSGSGSESESESESESGETVHSEPPPQYFGHHKIKFGPFLALGALEFLFFGEIIIEAYFSLLS